MGLFCLLIYGPLDVNIISSTVSNCFESSSTSGEDGPAKKRKCPNKFIFHFKNIQDTDDFQEMRNSMQNATEKDETCDFNFTLFKANSQKFILAFSHNVTDECAENITIGVWNCYLNNISNDKGEDISLLPGVVEFSKNYLQLYDDDQFQFRRRFWESYLLPDSNFEFGLRPDSKLSVFPEMIIRKSIQTSVDTEILFQNLCGLNILPSTFFGSIFALLLFRYTTSTDFCFLFSTNDPEILKYTPENNKPWTPLITIIRMQLASVNTFLELINLLNQSLINAFQNFIPVDAVKEILKVKDGKMSLPIFSYIKQSSTIHEEYSKYQITKLNIGKTKSLPSLMFQLIETISKIDCIVEYNVSLFKECTVTRLMGHFCTLLEGVERLTDFAGNISDLPILLAEEREMFRKWNQNNLTFDRNLCIHHVFENIARNYPDRIALTENNEKITYEELNQQSSSLANVLHNVINIEPETVIGVCLNKSIKLVICILAIIKADGAYLPLDPSHPPKRLKSLVEECEPKKILVEYASNHLFPTSSILLIENLQEMQEAKMFSRVNPNNLVYILHTSGSTGTPKGVMIEHKNLVAFVKGMEKAVDICNDGILLAVSYNFCLFHGLLFTALCTGSKGIIAPNILQIPLLKSIEEITLIASTPAGFQQLLADDEMPRNLQTVLLGGDNINPQLIKDIYKWKKNTKVYITHGGTELTLFDTIALLDEQSIGEMGIGRPFPNMKIFIVDKNMSQVPIGVVGEICVSGPQISRGYLKNPERTSQKFIKNDFRDMASESDNYLMDRIYKTGDLGRWKPNGTIEFIGRSDFQVKIRGIRIELEEISNAALKCPDIKEAVVVARKNHRGIEKLVAYYSIQTGIVFNEERLRAVFKSELPSYMIPTHMIQLESLPRNVNGKIDRGALPDFQKIFTPKADRLVSKPKHHDYQNSILALVRKVLDDNTIDLNDNFVEQGLDSIQANYLTVILMREFQVELQVQKLFENPSVAELNLLIHEIVNGSQKNEAFDPDNEAFLDKNLVQCPINKTNINEHPCQIFLTGATGFLGGFVLHELLQQTTANVYCLTRAINENEGLLRIRNNLEFFKLWNGTNEERIHCIPGDLTLLKFGLNDKVFDKLSKEVDSIYHCGGHVNFILPYSILRSHAVDSMKELLHFASRIKTKIFHHISSVAVFESTSMGLMKTVLKESDDIDSLKYDLQDMGYVRFKWVSEKLVWNAAKYGLPVQIFRLSFLLGDSRTGAMSTREFVSKFIKGCIQLGFYPDDNTNLNFVPVDYVAKAIVHISLNKKFCGKAFHLTSSEPLSVGELFNWINHYGYSVYPSKCNEWITKLENEALMNHKNELLNLLQFAFGIIKNNSSKEYDDSETKQALIESDISCPNFTAETMMAILNFFKNVGFIDNPAVSS